MSVNMKKCPYCAEEIQEDAKKCRHCGMWLDKVSSSNTVKGKPWYKKWWGILIIIFLVLGFLYALVDSYEKNKITSKTKSSTSNQTNKVPALTLTIGEQITTKKQFAVCKYSFYLDELTKYANQKDQAAVLKMINSGNCFNLPSNTRVIVEEINRDGVVSIRKIGTRESLWTYYEYLQEPSSPCRAVDSPGGRGYYKVGTELWRHEDLAVAVHNARMFCSSMYGGNYRTLCLTGIDMAIRNMSNLQKCYKDIFKIDIPSPN